MKIGFVVTHPTQFDGPFFRYAASDPEHCFQAVFTAPERMGAPIDPELGLSVSWEIDLLSGYQHWVVPGRGRIRWFWRHLREQRYDLLVVNGYAHPAYVVATAAARLAHTPVALRLDTVNFAHSSRPRLEAKKVLFGGLRRTYDHFFPVGSLTTEYLRGLGVPDQRMSFLSYSVDSEYFTSHSQITPLQRETIRARYGIPIGARVALSIAKFHPREAPWDLIRAIAAVPDPDVYVLLVGDGPQRRALEAFAGENCMGRAVFAGYVPYPELPSLYAAADVFVHAPMFEPWGVSVHEALACGLPVVAASTVGSAHDLVLPGENGAVYPFGDVAALRKTLRHVMETVDRAQVRNTSQAVLEAWHYARMWRNLVEAAERCSRARRASANHTSNESPVGGCG